MLKFLSEYMISLFMTHYFSVKTLKDHSYIMHRVLLYGHVNYLMTSLALCCCCCFSRGNTSKWPHGLWTDTDKSTFPRHYFLQGSFTEQDCGSSPNSSTCPQRRSRPRPRTATWNMSGTTVALSFRRERHVFSPFALLGPCPGSAVLFPPPTDHHFCCLV